jgi:hypothetical protein
VNNQIETGWAIGGVPDDDVIRQHLATLAAAAPALATAVANLAPPHRSARGAAG